MCKPAFTYKTHVTHLGKQLLFISISDSIKDFEIEKGYDSELYWMSFDSENQIYFGMNLIYKMFGGRKYYPTYINKVGLIKNLTSQELETLVLKQNNGYFHYDTRFNKVCDSIDESIKSLKKYLGFNSDDNIILLEYL